MTAGRYDLALEQGVTRRLRVNASMGNPSIAIDLTGYSAKMQIRATASTSSPPILTLDSVTTPPASSLTLGGAAGTIDILIAAADTDNVTLRTAVYDLEITAPNGDVTRLLKGAVTLDPEVTR